MNEGIKAVCKRCGKNAPVESFVLDPVYKLMVCQNCVKERKDRERNALLQAQQEAEKAKKEEEMKKNKPAGWDDEDEYLEKVTKQKKESQKVTVEDIDGERVKYKCPKCKYEFVYNTVRKYPKVCPYCNSMIFEFRFS